jgi:hypothetical protein
MGFEFKDIESAIEMRGEIEEYVAQAVTKLNKEFEYKTPGSKGIYSVEYDRQIGTVNALIPINDNLVKSIQISTDDIVLGIKTKIKNAVYDPDVIYSYLCRFIVRSLI